MDGELHGLEAHLGRGAADHEGQVVGRAGRRPEGLHLLGQELLEARRVQDRLGLLEQAALVGGASPLRDEEQLVLHPFGRVEVDLRGEVRPGVLLLVHLQRDGLRVAQVLARVGLEHAPREVLLVLHAGPDPLPLLAEDRGRPRVLAVRQDELRGDLGVAEQGDRHAPVVGRSLRIGEDRRDLLEVRSPLQEGHVAQRLPRDEREGFGRDLQDLPSLERHDRNVVFREEAVLRGVGAEGDRVLVDEFGHLCLPSRRARVGSPGRGNDVRVGTRC